MGSAGSTAAFILGACKVSLTWQLWANVIGFLASIPGLLIVGFFFIANDSTIDYTATSDYAVGNGSDGFDEENIKTPATTTTTKEKESETDQLQNSVQIDVYPDKVEEREKDKEPH